MFKIIMVLPMFGMSLISIKAIKQPILIQIILQEMHASIISLLYHNTFIFISKAS